jgi:hypothetical protein
VSESKPITLDDAIRLLPGLARFRTIDADTLRKLLARGKRECTWCGGELPKRRQSWCSDECVKEFQLRCDQGTFRSHVEKRADGKCERCGHDTVAAEKAFISYELSMQGDLPTGWKERDAALKPKRDELRYARGRWREVDHVIPVCEGGGLCRPDNLRLLCGTCHNEATKALAKRRGKDGAA